MKKTPEPLMDDLLAETAPPEFRAALLAQTLRTARLRKRKRQFSLALSVALGAGVSAFVLQHSVPHGALPTSAHRPMLNVVDSTSAIPVQSVSTGPEADSSFTVIQTAATTGPQTVSDGQLFAQLPNQPVILIRPNSSQAELMVLNMEDGRILPVR